jgi:integrase
MRPPRNEPGRNDNASRTGPTSGTTRAADPWPGRDVGDLNHPEVPRGDSDHGHQVNEAPAPVLTRLRSGRSPLLTSPVWRLSGVVVAGGGQRKPRCYERRIFTCRSPAGANCCCQRRRRRRGRPGPTPGRGGTAASSNSVARVSRRPYDLRHACVSTWLGSGVPSAQVAEWAGHSVAVLHQICAKVLAGQEASARDRIERALGLRAEDAGSAGPQIDH